MKILRNYKETESFLFSQLPMYQRVGPKKFKVDLKNIKSLSKSIGDPHKDFKSIHVAGTNGKGSTSFFLATLLDAQGYKTGLYTSPHYRTYRERTKVGGKLIKKSFVVSFVNALIKKGVFESSLKPSFFEITVAMAFAYFKEEQVDFAIIETGLGGRLDSTNIIRPELSLITNIGMDHTNFLGNTLNKIAKEKAGIIKPEVPVVIGKRQKETEKVFHSKAKDKNSKLIYAEDFKPRIPKNIVNDFPEYQLENMRTALVGLETINLRATQNDLTKAWTKGLKKWGFLGRYMKVINETLEIYDSAHNREGLEVLFKEIRKESYINLHIVMAVVADKELDKVLPLFPSNAQYYFSQAKIPRALKKEELLKQGLKHQLKGKPYSTIRKALAAARRRASKQDLILVTGSIYTVAEVC